MTLRNIFLTALLPAAGLTVWLASVHGDGLDPRLQKAENDRIALIEKIKKPVLAVLAPGGQGGGSGVILTEDGYAITNFHVAAAVGTYFHCGTSDGEMYDAVLVGLDREGDLALIKLIQKKDHEVKFPTAVIGDSDQLRPGDMTLALGNPLLLATDFNPTVTYGMVSGTHRYQKIPHPSGTLLEYCDCIQVDTAINPGNSGGPLFNMKGEWVGINSAGSLGKSDRINSGAAYSISVNMIKNFLGHLRAGLECDHATLGADVEPENEDGGLGDLVVRRVVSGSDVDRRGLSPGDTLLSFAGFPLTNINQYKNKLGIFPKGWRVPLVFRHDRDDKRQVLVRLPGRRPDVLPDGRTDDVAGDPQVTPKPLPPPPAGTEAAKLFIAKPGFANYYFNKLERDRLLKAFHQKTGDFSGLPGRLDPQGVGRARPEDRRGPDFGAGAEQGQQERPHRRQRGHDRLRLRPAEHGHQVGGPANRPRAAAACCWHCISIESSWPSARRAFPATSATAASSRSTCRRRTGPPRTTPSSA